MANTNYTRSFEYLFANNKDVFDDEALYNVGALLGDSDTNLPELYTKFSASSDEMRRRGAHWSHIFYNNVPQYAEERNARFIEYELLQNKSSPPVDTVACPRCGVNNLVQGENKRAADEGGISFAVCKQCGLKWSPEWEKDLLIIKRLISVGLLSCFLGIAVWG